MHSRYHHKLVLNNIACRVSFDLKEGWRYIFWGSKSSKHKNWKIRCNQVHEESLWFDWI